MERDETFAEDKELLELLRDYGDSSTPRPATRSAWASGPSTSVVS